jgi:hypothetical protein
MTATPWIAGPTMQRVFNELTPLAKIIVDDGAGTTYVCEAPPGSGSAESVWRLQKIVVSGTDTTIGYANGDARFIYVARDMTSYSYS